MLRFLHSTRWSVNKFPTLAQFHTTQSNRFLFNNKKNEIQTASNTSLGSKIFKAATLPFTMVGRGLVAVAAFGIAKTIEKHIVKMEKEIQNNFAAKKDEPPYALYLLNNLVKHHPLIQKILDTNDDQCIIFDYSSVTIEPQVSKKNLLNFKYTASVTTVVDPIDNEAHTRHLEEQVKAGTMTKEAFMEHAWESSIPVEKFYTCKAKSTLNEKTNQIELIKFELQNRDGNTLLKWNEQEVQEAMEFVFQKQNTATAQQEQTSWFSKFGAQSKQKQVQEQQQHQQEIEVEFRETKK